jgi:hypothetical protein
MILERDVFIPLPREPHEQERTFQYAASRLVDEMVVFGNGPVYAVIGNGAHENLQTQIKALKGDRGTRQPVGLSLQFEQFLPYVDDSEVKDDSIRSLLKDPAELTSRIGGLSFVRAQATMEAQDALPPCTISEDGTTIQNYSPIGNPRTTRFLDSALRKGVDFPVITSANKSGEPEIVGTEAAIEFAQQASLPFVPNTYVSEGRDKPKGSYPIIEVGAAELIIIRNGFLGEGIMDALLAGYPTTRADNVRQTNYPEGVLSFDNLPPEARRLIGFELRRLILPYLGSSVIR